ncbi:MAG: Winged helix-turn-helix transcriptional regulator [Acidobacteriota bacterium]|nr:Winged helix-turn-helix transcriptional regulator [Acidobacteriota bacterium]
MINDWEQIFAQGENDRVEFKKTFSGEKEIIETIGAFLNHKGGMIIIGYDEKKSEIVEPNIGQETIQKFINKVKILTNPQVIVDIYESEYKGKRLLVIDVIEYPIKPVAVQGRYYRRRMNSNHILTPTEISSLHLFSLNSSWDYQLSQSSTLKDIDMVTVEWFIQKLSHQKDKKIIDPPMNVLGKYELIRENRPTFAALLLFPKAPSFILDVQIGLFEDEITIKKDKNIKKSVLFEVEDIMDFITAYITKEFIITGKPQREERWQYPLEAIREIAMNAVIHRDYQEGTHTQIKVFRDKISFWNSGKLPPDSTIDDIKSGAIQSKPRNRLLAQIFKELGIIEKYGAGVKRVIEDFRAYGLLEPSFEEKFGGFYVVASDLKSKKGTTQEITNIINEFRATTQETTQEIEESTQETTPEISEKIIQLIEKNPKLTRRAIADLIGISDNGVKYHLKKLRREGRITHVGPTKKGYWEIISP